MKKSELLSALHEEYPMLKAEQVETIIELILDQLITSIKKGVRIEIRGFGSFSLREHKVKASFPSGDNKTEYKKIKSIYFRIGKNFFNRINSVSAK